MSVASRINPLKSAVLKVQVPITSSWRSQGTLGATKRVTDTSKSADVSKSPDLDTHKPRVLITGI